MEQKIRGLLAYLFGWIGGLIILLAFKDNNDQTKFNACQSIVSSAGFWIIGIVARFIPFIGLIVSSAASILTLIITIIGMIKAYHEENFEIPVISDLTRNIFKSQLS